MECKRKAHEQHKRTRTEQQHTLPDGPFTHQRSPPRRPRKGGRVLRRFPSTAAAPIHSSPPTLSDDEGYGQLRQAPEQDAHALHPLRPPQLPPPEEHLLLLRLPRRPHPQVQLECEGHQAQDHRNWKDEVHAPRASQVQEQLQRRDRGCPQEESCGQLGLYFATRNPVKLEFKKTSAWTVHLKPLVLWH